MALVNYFDQYRLGRPNCDPPIVQFCYILPKDFHSFPSMTYHFEDANLQVAPDNVFIIDRAAEYFMLAIVPHDYWDHGSNVILGLFMIST